MNGFWRAALGAVLAAGVLLGGCKGPEAAGGGKKMKICLLPKKKGIGYFTSCAKGAAEAAKELGDVELIYDGPTDGSAREAAAMIERWTLQGVKAIAVSPNDPAVLERAMEKARAAGVRVITWDADAAAGAREFFVNQATARQIGYALVDTMARDLGGEGARGDVAIITATLTAANQNEWMKYMKERLEKYPGLKLVSVRPSEEDQKIALQEAQSLMKAYPDLKGIFGISSMAFPGAAAAVQQAGRSGQVLVTGLSLPSEMRKYVKDGTVKSFVLWKTQDLGYLTIRVAHDLAAGTLKAGAKTFDAGRLGAKAVEGDNVLLGDIMIFTKDNIDQFDF